MCIYLLIVYLTVSICLFFPFLGGRSWHVSSQICECVVDVLLECFISTHLWSSAFSSSTYSLIENKYACKFMQNQLQEKILDSCGVLSPSKFMLRPSAVNSTTYSSIKGRCLQVTNYFYSVVLYQDIYDWELSAMYFIFQWKYICLQIMHDQEDFWLVYKFNAFMVQYFQYHFYSSVKKICKKIIAKLCKSHIKRNLNQHPILTYKWVILFIMPWLT